MPQKISIIIPTYEHLLDFLIPCIDSICKYTDLNNVEVIVSANGCSKATKDYVEKLGEPFKLVWNEAAIGYSKACNAGIKAATGDYIVLLNNDILLLEHPKNRWLDYLLEPFKDKKVGITGPILGPSAPAGRDFIIFFCACIKKEVIEKIGLLDEIFGIGGGEDTDFCIRAENIGYKLVQVPSVATTFGGGLVVGGFPIYHKGEGTVHDPKCVENWQGTFDKNSKILAERYNRHWVLCNNYERAVIGKNDAVPPRENARYKWARKNIVGNKILEIGCSSGYGLKYFGDIEKLDYLGIDKDEGIIKYAKENFGNKFKVADISNFTFEHYDTIIAFEVLEHLENGKELAQKLKQHCECLLVTAPYKEVPGMWGYHHKLHQLEGKDFPNFETKYILENGKITDIPDKFNGLNLMLMKWYEGMSEVKVKEIKEKLKEGVTAIVSTKDRYYTSLPNCLISIALQTVKPKKLIVYDDGEQKDLRIDPLYKNIFLLLSNNGIKWEIKFGARQGQVRNHQRSIMDSNTEWIWRIDDDNVLEADVLEKLMKNIKPNVGAIGGLVVDPKIPISSHKLASNKIEDIYLGLNIQWFKEDRGVIEVDHLYSTFIYRKEAAEHGYCLDLSKVGHREETVFSHEMKRAGWKLLVDTSAVTWHLRNDIGGIRSDSHQDMWAHDEQIFAKKLEKWGVIPNKYKFIVLDCGLGDSLMFKSILPEIKEKYKDHKIVISNCYPECFSNEDIISISIAEAQMILGDLSNYNVYKWAWDRNWKTSLIDAYRGLYDV